MRVGRPYNMHSLCGRLTKARDLLDLALRDHEEDYTEQEFFNLASMWAEIAEMVEVLMDEARGLEAVKMRTNVMIVEGLNNEWNVMLEPFSGNSWIGKQLDWDEAKSLADSHKLPVRIIFAGEEFNSYEEYEAALPRINYL